MNELMIFENPAFGKVRATQIDDEPWFVGKDVAEMLGYNNSRDALAKHVDSEDKGVAKCDTPGGIQKITIINESGLYSLILSSKLPAAKEFKHWVTSEVLPSIRKTGSYHNPNATFSAGGNERYMRAQAMLMNAKSRVSKQMQKLWDRAGVKPEYQALAMQDYYDGLQLPREAFVNTATALYDATTIAKELGVMSKNGNPHALAIGAIIGKLDISPEEWEETPYSRNGHDGISVQYTESVVKKIRNWLEASNYPCPIYGRDGKKYTVKYKI